ncbi:hypothetical protein [Ferruginibacter sp.]
MKKFFAFALTALLLLILKSSSLFANKENCKTTICSSTKIKCTENKKEKFDFSEFEINPFTILIPGNNF